MCYYMKTEITNYERSEIFNYYNNKDNPFLYLTTKVDITNIYNKCKKYYPSIAYFITLALNKIDNFKYRYENNKIYKYDTLNINFTQIRENNNIGFFSCDFKDNYHDFLKEYKRVQEQFKKNKSSIAADDDEGEAWFSYVPWFNMSSLITPYDKKNTIPQFIWDKFTHENEKYYINLTIMVHHGFVDGFHIATFLKTLEEIIENIDNYI